MKILLVDDHELFRAGLRMLLSTIDHNATILEASTLGEALALAAKHPDLQLCLLDLALKGERGLDGLQQIKESAPNVAVVVVSALEDISAVHRCIDAGAMSFVPKSAPPQVLTEALRQVLAGAVYLPDEVLNDSTSHAVVAPNLTPRQLEVLHALSLGSPTKAIARKLDISESTVNEHIAVIFRALGVHNRTQAVIEAGRLGL
jgi:DNA-binding NarL/FixJ family response regulator